MFGFFDRKLKIATHAKIEFIQSKKVLDWSLSDGTILQFALRHGIETKQSCCKGHCGVCAVKILSGQVIYKETVSFKTNDDYILLCSAYPAQKTKEETPYLRIDL